MPTQTTAEAALQDGKATDEIAGAVAELRQCFGVEFSILEAASGQIVYAATQQPAGHVQLLAELARVVGDYRSPEFISDEDPVLVLALPFATDKDNCYVAVRAFVTRHVLPGESVSGPARLLDVKESEAADWINRQEVWTAKALERLAATVLAKLVSDKNVERLEDELDKMSENLMETYEEISLLHGVTRTLRKSGSIDELLHLVPMCLYDVLPAEGIAVQVLAAAEPGTEKRQTPDAPPLLTSGHVPLDAQQFASLVEQLKVNGRGDPLVLNRSVTQTDTWKFPEIRQLIVVPLPAGDHVVGWLAAVNHSADDWFGTVEASLLNSVGVILGLCIHSGRIAAYKHQCEILGNMVKAFISAIDAKDPCTSGHSQRVARVAVKLAQQLGCDEDALNTIYVAALLHDIGKIGIADNLLQKSGKLSEAEYEQIKAHPQLGFGILGQVDQLRDVFPIVLYHHERWDGTGYPAKLKGAEIPLPARILAVADAFDAMTSERPYREIMADEQVDEILRAGSGEQWDPQVVDQLFNIRGALSQEKPDISSPPISLYPFEKR